MEFFNRIDPLRTYATDCFQGVKTIQLTLNGTTSLSTDTEVPAQVLDYSQGFDDRRASW